MSGTVTSSAINNTGALSTGGNTILPPPRLSGDPKGDAIAMQRWLNLLYDQMIVVANVYGQVLQDGTNIATMQSQIATFGREIIYESWLGRIFLCSSLEQSRQAD